MKAPGANCGQCPAKDAIMVPPEPATARGGARIVFVGDSPSKSDLRQRRPFTGATGRMLGRGLRVLSLPLARHHVHWTNAVLCDVGPKELAAARKCCAPRLRQELQEACAAASKPPVVVPVGKFALQSVLGLSRAPAMVKWRGSITPHDIDGAAFVAAPMLHPAFAMRSPAWLPVIEADFRRVDRLLELPRTTDWQPPENAPTRRLVVARTITALRTALAQLAPGAAVGFDVETVGLGPTRTALVCFAISDGVLTVVVPWARGRDGMQCHWRDRGATAAALVNDCFTSRLVVTHNGPGFDWVVARRYGIKFPPRWGDTLLVAHATKSHLPKGLATVVTYHAELDVAPWKEFEDRTADLDRLYVYNGRDTLYTILAWQRIKGEVNA